jgi:nucleoside-diphosphate-sugar epimerase
MHLLVTGAAGFIGYHLCEKLLARGDTVVGFDNLNDYYDVNEEGMGRIEKPFWTRIFLAAFAVGTLGLLGSAIAVAERTHASIVD